jgi:SAM-dependent methyltransferase
MPQPPILIDRTTLIRNRAKASAMFLQNLAVSEIQERLKEVNRTFTRPAVVTGFPELWPEMPTVRDDETLMFPEARHDLVISALCLHWANDPVGQLVQCRRALQPDGWFIGLMLGGQTLHELRSALAQAESEITGGLSPRILPMGEIRDLGALLQRAGLRLPVADSFSVSVRYRDALHLMRDLRAMGEGNALFSRMRKPTRRGVFDRASTIYQTLQGSDGLIPATFEFIVLTGWAPHEQQPKPLRPGSAAYRLADALLSAESTLEGNSDA